MSVSYGYGGLAPGTSHQNVRKAWDTLLHEQVLNKSAWKGLIGQDKGGEGDLDSETVNKPIVLKTQLGKESGDQITMGLVASLVKQAWVTNGSDAANWFNMGKSGNQQLVDNETPFSLYNVKVKIAHQRFGTTVDGKMTLQRTPYQLLNVAKDRISEQMVYFLDSDVFMALYSGYGANIYRELGTTAAAPTAHPNQIYGNGQSSIANVTSADTFTTASLEIVRVFWETANINPINVDGDKYGLVYVHPNNGATLRADSAWVDANAFAQPRGNDNPIFQNKLGMWAGLVVKESNKISTEFDPTKITITSNVITGSGGAATMIDAPTMGAGVSATNVYMCTLVGANAVARAFALESYMARRKEDDYENIYGFGGGFIFGDRRGDFSLSQDSGSDGATKNQSSAVLHYYAPSITVPTVW